MSQSGWAVWPQNLPGLFGRKRLGLIAANHLGIIARKMRAGNELENAFRHLQFVRTVNQHGLVSVQRFYIYAERGLANKRVSIWIHRGKLHIEYQKTLLAQYTCQLNRKSKTLKSVSTPQLYQTPFASTQLELFELDEGQWQKIYRRPSYNHHIQSGPIAQQLPLFTLLYWLFLH